MSQPFCSSAPFTCTARTRYSKVDKTYTCSVGGCSFPLGDHHLHRPTMPSGQLFFLPSRDTWGTRWVILGAQYLINCKYVCLLQKLQGPERSTITMLRRTLFQNVSSSFSAVLVPDGGWSLLFPLPTVHSALRGNETSAVS